MAGCGQYSLALRCALGSTARWSGVPSSGLASRGAGEGVHARLAATGGINNHTPSTSHSCNQPTTHRHTLASLTTLTPLLVLQA